MSTPEENALYEAEDYESAFAIFLSLAEAGHIQAQVSIGGMYFSGEGTSPSLDKSLYWYGLAAEAGHPVAQNNLAHLAFFRDPAEAIPLLFTSAKKGSPCAQSALGDVYSGEFNLPEDLKSQYDDRATALDWYHQAGDNGYCNGYRRLGEMYLEGEEDERDVAKAILYYTKAAEAGDETSQEFLERAYREGLPGLEPDEEKANYWANCCQASEG